MVMKTDRVSETVSSGLRPSFQQRYVCSLVEVTGQRRQKEEVTCRPVLAPVKYADTAYVYINNTRRRFVSKTLYEPRMKPRSFSETTYVNPKTVAERYVSCLDHYNDENKKWFKTYLELKANVFRSSRYFIPNSGSGAFVPMNGYDPDENGRFNGLVDENMNTRIPEHFQERYDPGASQVFIPRRKPASNEDVDLDLIEGQLIFNTQDKNSDFLVLNGQLDECSDL